MGRDEPVSAATPCVGTVALGANRRYWGKPFRGATGSTTFRSAVTLGSSSSTGRGVLSDPRNSDKRSQPILWQRPRDASTIWVLRDYPPWRASICENSLGVQIVDVGDVADSVETGRGVVEPVVDSRGDLPEDVDGVAFASIDGNACLDVEGGNSAAC